MNIIGLKNKSMQEKSIFIIVSFNDTFQVKTSQFILHYLFQLEVKNSEMNYFNTHANDIKYVQYDESTCCFSSLSSDLFDSREYVSEKAIVL